MLRSLNFQSKNIDNRNKEYSGLKTRQADRSMSACSVVCTYDKCSIVVGIFVLVRGIGDSAFVHVVVIYFSYRGTERTFHDSFTNMEQEN